MGFAIGVTVAVLLAALLLAAMNGFWARKARQVRAQNPSAWVQPVMRGEVFYLLYLDSSVIKLISFGGHDYQVHDRNDLREARVGSVRSGVARRKAVELDFADGSDLQLLPSRFSRRAAADAVVQSAVEYLNR